MSWLFSRALVEASSAAISSDGGLYAPSSAMPTPQVFSLPVKTTDVCRRFPSGMTCERLTDDRGEAVLMWCLADSLARTSARRDKAPASTAPAPACGERWRGSLAKYDRASSSWKTPQCSLLAGLDAFSETWPRWGMMRNGECSGLATPVRRISENESGSWPTPNKMDMRAEASMCSPEIWQERQEAKARQGIRLQFPLRVAVMMWPAKPAKGQAYPRETWPTPRKCSAMAARMTPEAAWADRFPNLETVLARRMWPTPTKSDGLSGPGKAASCQGGMNLRTAVQRFPTPTVNDSKNNNPPSQALRNTPPLNVVVGGNMNPTWVEWLMGWPLGWTDLRASAMDRFRQWCALHGAR